MNPRTRSERAEAFTCKNQKWLSDMPVQAASMVEAIASQFARNGTDSIENPHIFRIPEVVQAGGFSALQQLGNPADILLKTKERMFAA